MALIQLAKISTKAPKEFNKDKIKAKTTKLLEELDELQNLLFAENKHSVLVVIQGMDASGKDGVIKNIFGKQSTTAYGFAGQSVENQPRALSATISWSGHSG